MLDERPRLFFVPYWTNEDAIKRAKGLQTATSDMTATVSGKVVSSR
ncbi:MAG: hypothetical protein WBW08_02775 [Methyloceanibacter sp.]